MQQRAERDEFGGCGGFCKICPHINVYEIWKARFSEIFTFFENILRRVVEAAVPAARNAGDTPAATVESAVIDRRY
jgi:hypothetical protein